MFCSVSEPSSGASTNPDSKKAARFGTARDAGFCALLKAPAALEPLWSVPKKRIP